MQLDDIAAAAVGLGVYELLRQRNVIVQPVANPAAGADWLAKVPAGEAWELLAVTELLTTSAAVANRQLSLQVKDANGNLLGQSDAPAVQAAGAAKVYSFQENLGTPSAIVALRAQIPAPGIPLGENMQVNSLTALIDAGDQHSKIVLVVRQWSLTDVQQAADWYARRQWTG